MILFVLICFDNNAYWLTVFCFICADHLSHHANMRANLEGIQMHHLVSDKNTRNGPDSMSAVSMPVCTCIIH